MSVFFFLIPLAVFLGFAGLIAFIWSLKSGQYDDMDGAAMRILIDEEEQIQHTPPDETENRDSK